MGKSSSEPYDSELALLPFLFFYVQHHPAYFPATHRLSFLSKAPTHRTDLHLHCCTWFEALLRERKSSKIDKMDEESEAAIDAASMNTTVQHEGSIATQDHAKRDAPTGDDIKELFTSAFAWANHSVPNAETPSSSPQEPTNTEDWPTPLTHPSQTGEAAEQSMQQLTTSDNDSARLEETPEDLMFFQLIPWCSLDAATILNTDALRAFLRRHCAGPPNALFSNSFHDVCIDDLQHLYRHRAGLLSCPSAKLRYTEEVSADEELDTLTKAAYIKDYTEWITMGVALAEAREQAKAHDIALAYELPKSPEPAGTKQLAAQLDEVNGSQDTTNVSETFIQSIADRLAAEILGELCGTSDLPVEEQTKLPQSATDWYRSAFERTTSVVRMLTDKVTLPDGSRLTFDECSPATATMELVKELIKDEDEPKTTEASWSEQSGPASELRGAVVDMVYEQIKAAKKSIDTAQGRPSATGTNDAELTEIVQQWLAEPGEKTRDECARYILEKAWDQGKIKSRPYAFAVNQPRPSSPRRQQLAWSPYMAGASNHDPFCPCTRLVFSSLHTTMSISHESCH